MPTQNPDPSYGTQRSCAQAPPQPPLPSRCCLGSTAVPTADWTLLRTKPEMCPQHRERIVTTLPALCHHLQMGGQLKEGI